MGSTPSCSSFMRELSRQQGKYLIALVNMNDIHFAHPVAVHGNHACCAALVVVREVYWHSKCSSTTSSKRLFCIFLYTTAAQVSPSSSVPDDLRHHRSQGCSRDGHGKRLRRMPKILMWTTMWHHVPCGYQANCLADPLQLFTTAQATFPRHYGLLRPGASPSPGLLQQCGAIMGTVLSCHHAAL